VIKATRYKCLDHSLSGQLLVSAIWSLVGVVVGGRNQIGKAQSMTKSLLTCVYCV